jgi:hypothetical protein
MTILIARSRGVASVAVLSPVASIVLLFGLLIGGV